MSRIIKGAQLESSALPVMSGQPALCSSGDAGVPTTLADAVAQTEEKAKDILAHARIEASKIIDEANLRTARIERDAYQRGLERGTEEGTLAARGEILDHIEALKLLASQASLDRQELLQNSERAVVRLATEVARKIIQHEISLDPSLVARVVRSAIEKVNATDLIRVRVNPQDLEALRNYIKESSHPKASGWEFEADPDVEPGGCIIDTRVGILDAQLDVQLKEIEESFEKIAELG